MSFSLGPSSRWWFVLLPLGTLVVLAWIICVRAAKEERRAHALGGARGWDEPS